MACGRSTSSESRKAITVATQADRKIAFTLSDSFCVERHRAEFLKLIKDHADIVFANEQDWLDGLQLPEGGAGGGAPTFSEAIALLRGVAERICAGVTSDPEQYVRPRDAVFRVDYEPPSNQYELGRQLVADYQIQKLTSCSTCHR